MSKKIFLKIILILMPVGSFIWAQNSLRNFGNLKVFNDAKIGFHANLVNDGAFDENEGLVGFYGDNSLSITGALAPSFLDFEILVEDELRLGVPININNALNFVDGDIVTPKVDGGIYVQLLENAFYVGESDTNKVNGYSSAFGFQSFIFPVGDSELLRPLTMNAEEATKMVKCAYFFENPNNPSSISESFETGYRTDGIKSISSMEFWRFQSPTNTTITISWNSRSDMGNLASNIHEITIVGWKNSTESWVNIGATAVSGDLDQGFLISENFVPDEYGAITFGTLSISKEILEIDNFLMTPNGDGINDVLIVEELISHPKNRISIFNRYGSKVFEMLNYTDEFSGDSNLDNFVINRDRGLPNGVYFYMVHLDDLAKDFQGYLYLAR